MSDYKKDEDTEKMLQAIKCLRITDRLIQKIDNYGRLLGLVPKEKRRGQEQIRPTLYELNREITKLVYDEDPFFFKEEEAKKYTEADCFSIKGSFKKDKYIIQTPLLPSIYNKKTGKVFSNLYVDEVSLFLRSNEKKIPKFDQANIAVVSVRENNKIGVDNDNVDSKAIVDAIASHLKGGDNPRSCSFFLASIFDDFLEEGTYFIVTENYGQPPHLEEIRDWISDIQED
ncbi:hypothetical protein ACKQTC_07160 [Peptococcus simiae]|uniref:Uncharacterized protein n=1 Tax=Peptococcus simiae TaxID=1643805 RepID=A0ABW9H013_9FIRM